MRKIRKHVIFITKETNFNVSNKRCTKPTAFKTHSSDVTNLDQGLQSQEKWSRKNRIQKPSNFSGTDLKNILKFENLETYINPRIENVVCVFCRYYNDNEIEGPIEWLGCDNCSNWMHKTCAEKNNLCTSSNKFSCSKCMLITKKPKDHVHSSSVNLITSDFNSEKFEMQSIFNSEKYDLFINSNLKMSINDLAENEFKTRNQRQSEDWRNERRKRVTASTFGSICKARSDKRLFMIADSIINPKSLANIPAVKHGITNEQKALLEYELMTGVKCTASGLQIHPDYQYIAGSPDALVGTDGVLEIKCPFIIKNMNPSESFVLKTLPYLDKNGGLRVNSDYYFQVQGLLEITNREWCDFFIYTNRGNHLERINRNRGFWKNAFLKLKSFYYFFMIPLLTDPNALIEKPIKWTTIGKIEFFENGLVKDSKFYLKDIKKRFYVGFYPNTVCNIKKITSEEYATLNGSQWLSNFIVDICLNIIDTINIFNIISCSLSTLVLTDGTINNYIINQIQFFQDNIVVMPFLINNNHFCLCIANFNKKEFTYLDPYGSESNAYLPKLAFKNVLKLLKEYIKENEESQIFISLNWTLLFQKHINQSDSYNCGVYIIYFFRQVFNNHSLEEDINIDDFRKHLLRMLLETSEKVSKKCIYCGREANEKEIIHCKSCKRFAHIDDVCANREEYIYGICDLCKKY